MKNNNIIQEIYRTREIMGIVNEQTSGTTSGTTTGTTSGTGAWGTVTCLPGDPCPPNGTYPLDPNRDGNRWFHYSSTICPIKYAMHHTGLPAGDYGNLTWINQQYASAGIAPLPLVGNPNSTFGVSQMFTCFQMHPSAEPWFTPPGGLGYRQNTFEALPQIQGQYSNMQSAVSSGDWLVPTNIGVCNAGCTALAVDYTVPTDPDPSGTTSGTTTGTTSVIAPQVPSSNNNNKSRIKSKGTGCDANRFQYNSGCGATYFVPAPGNSNSWNSWLSKRKQSYDSVGCSHFQNVRKWITQQLEKGTNSKGVAWNRIQISRKEAKRDWGQCMQTQCCGGQK